MTFCFIGILVDCTVEQFYPFLFKSSQFSF